MLIKNYRSIFDVVREETNIVTVARFYGVAVDRHGRALCPFHIDHHPSLSFKDNRFTCFACGARGSVIDLVMQIFHISPLEAAVKLQEDFNLKVEVRGQSHKANDVAAKGEADTRSVKQETNGTKSAQRRAQSETNGKPVQPFAYDGSDGQHGGGTGSGAPGPAGGYGIIL